MERYERVRGNDSGVVAALSGCGLLCAVASGFALSTTSADAIKSFAWSVATSAPAAANQLPMTMYAGVRALATESADKMGVPVTFADAACGASAFCGACESSSAQTATALCVAMAVSALAALSFVRPGFSGRANLSVLANSAAALALAFAMYSFHQGCAQTMPEESTRLGSGFHLALISFICHTAAAVVQASDRQEFEAEELTDVFCQAPYNTSRKFAPTCPQVASGQLRATAYGQPRSYLPPPMYAETQEGRERKGSAIAPAARKRTVAAKKAWARKRTRELKRGLLRRKQCENGRMRLRVFRSNNHIYGQVIDDTKHHTMSAASTTEPAIVSQLDTHPETGVPKTWDVAAAKAVGKVLGQRAKEAGIDKVFFDRGDFIYHGRVAAVADGAREAGLEF